MLNPAAISSLCMPSHSATPATVKHVLKEQADLRREVRQAICGLRPAQDTATLGAEVQEGRSHQHKEDFSHQDAAGQGGTSCGEEGRLLLGSVPVLIYSSAVYNSRHFELWTCRDKDLRLSFLPADSQTEGHPVPT